MTSNVGNATPSRCASMMYPKMLIPFYPEYFVCLFKHVTPNIQNNYLSQILLFQNNKSCYLMTQQESEILLFLECLSFQLK